VFLFNDNNPEALMIGHQHIVAMIAAGIIDVFILDDELLEIYSNIEFIQPLERILAEINRSNPDVYNRIAEYIVYELYEVDDYAYEERIIAIKIGKSPLLSRLGIFEQEIFLGVSATTSNLENAKKAIILLFE
jgi:hypothetical protein